MKGLTILLVLAFALVINLPMVYGQLSGLDDRDNRLSTRYTVGLPGDDEDDDCPGDPAPVAATGQTECRDHSGILIDCAGTGQDGEYQAGVSVDPRFTDNGDGTVTDNLTGLIWLQNADCVGELFWNNAVANASLLAEGACGLTDGSVVGDWRLSNIRELLSLVDYGQSYPALPAGHPFFNVESSRYWTSTTWDFDDPTFAFAWTVFVDTGGPVVWPKSSFGGRSWLVRGGQ